MSCINPITINSKRSGKIHVACGKCEFCLTGKRVQWTVRLKEELRGSASAFFITLTYEEDQMPMSEHGIPEVSKNDIQLFMKKLRRADERAKEDLKKLKEDSKALKEAKTKYGFEYDPFFDSTLDRKLKYFLTSEYGPQTQRPHYHMVLFNLTPVMQNKLEKYWSTFDRKTSLRISKGFVKIDPVTHGRLHYVSKYITDPQPEIDLKRSKPFRLISKGIGQNYIDRALEYHQKTLNDYIVQDGYKLPIPRYLREKLFSKGEREGLNYRKREHQAEQYKKYLKELEKRWPGQSGKKEIEAIEHTRLLKEQKAKHNKPTSL
jgi:hypothetical protein